jgi:hypothetical protein
MKHSDIKMDKKVAKKAIGMHDKQMHGGKKTNLASLKKGGTTKKYAAGGSLLEMDRKFGVDKIRAMKPKTASEERLASANRSQSDSDIGPKFKSKPATMDKPKQSFGDAFKAARKSGKDKFTYNGKSYTTETAAEKSKAKDTESDTPMPTGNIGSRVMFEEGETAPAFKRGGMTKMSKGGCAKMARGGGIEKKGKTRGRFC